jgi:hypothetical protein
MFVNDLLEQFQLRFPNNKGFYYDIMYMHRIAKLDKRIGNCTVLACNKWQSIFAECEAALGFSGDAAKDVFSAWSRVATNSFNKRTGNERHKQTAASPPLGFAPPPRRSNSLIGLSGRTVKVPVQLIPLERARAMTSGGTSGSSLDEIRMRHRSLMISTSSMKTTASDDLQTLEERLEISRPLNIEDSTMCCSYPSGLSYRMSMSPYAPHADGSPSPTNIGAAGAEGDSSSSDKEIEGDESRSDLEETVSGSFDMKDTIRAYVDNVSTDRKKFSILK